ncbi:MAG TPA: flagellar motor protein MotB [Phycisphaerae bacterium]|nr:flagellar motor protein MotB [Phycisphaerae bacterium]HRW52535.1 flagellar motor protein MotB [Phycisphaerae bacterium]
MGKKCKCPPAGAPLWVLTYGDMMSLLLCFFILLAAMANFDDRDKLFMAALESIRKAFGSSGQTGYFPDVEVDFKSFMVKFETFYVPREKKNYGHSDEPGLDGEYYRVKRVRDGVELTVGGPIAFARFSAELEPDAELWLTKLAEELKGKRNKVEIRGHATSEPLPLESQYRDAIDLGYARARAVRDRLVALGVDPRAIRVSSAGSYEPIVRQNYSDDRRAANRRVDVMVTQALISDYTANPLSSTELTKQAEDIKPAAAP